MNALKIFKFEWYVLFFLLGLAFVLEVYQVDIWVANHLYELEGFKWQLRENFITQTIFHDLAKVLIQVSYLLLIIYSLTCKFLKRTTFFQGFNLTLVTMGIASLCVVLIKSMSNVSCPWDLIAYGGNLPYLSIFSLSDVSIQLGNCFPGGHAILGYSFISFYFALKIQQHSNAKIWLIMPILTGLILDITQQLRGAHFVSHGVWTLIIAWVINLFIFSIYAIKKSPHYKILNSNNIKFSMPKH